MAFVLQLQRRALEAMLSKRDFQRQFSVFSGMRYWLGKQEIFLLGISEGVGTCAGKFGVNIGVFSKERPENPLRFFEKGMCVMAALLRKPTKKEWADTESPRMLVERLDIKNISKDKTQFILDKKRQLYIPL